MVEIGLMFNPYKLETQLTVRGNPAEPKLVRELCGADGVDLSAWAGNFFPRAIAEFNDSVRVTFSGIRRDYEFLEDSLKACPEKGSILQPGVIAEPMDRLQKLRSLFEEMQKSAPFKDLKSKELKRLFDRATNSDFEMAVVATVSSGKSTLINAMLGNEILPARNEPTTATIVRIHDTADAKGFTAVAYDIKGTKLRQCDALTLERMNELNDDPKVSTIEVYGKIPGIASKAMRLVLTDTPGPNNSRTTEHREHTYRLLRDEYKPMILYVLNAEALGVTDDNGLLTDVAEAMKAGGRQDRDRFLFVLNKADEFDGGKGETASRKMVDVEKYLVEHGIKGARIFPTSAQMAKLIRQEKAGFPLTRKEQGVLRNCPDYLDLDYLHFSDFAPLSAACRKELDQEMAQARAENDEKRQVLIYSGVPAVEFAISEYLEKYALPAKIAKGVATFKDKIASLELEAKTQKIIASDNSKLEEIRQAIAELKKLLEKSDAAKDVKKKLETLNVDKEVNRALAEAGTKLSKAMREQTAGMDAKMCAEDARNQVKDLVEKVLPRIQSSFKASVEQALEYVLNAQAQKCIESYQAYVEAFLGKVKCPELIRPVLQPVPITVDEAIDDFKTLETVPVGSHYENGTGVRSFVARLFGWKSFFGSEGLKKVTDFGEREFVNFAEFMDRNLFPAAEAFEQNTRKAAISWSHEQTQKVRDAFVGRLYRLGEVIRQKIEELEKLLGDAEQKENAIKRNEANLVWLSQFIEKLDAVLSVTDVANPTQEVK